MAAGEQIRKYAVGKMELQEALEVGKIGTCNIREF